MVQRLYMYSSDQMGSDHHREKERLTIRSYDEDKDCRRVEELERRCEVVGTADRVFLFTDTLGDPICRIRNSPSFIMLVAELGNELVGVIRGSIKVVTLDHQKWQAPRNSAGLAKVGYVLGLRVVPHHRRKRIGLSLVRSLEQWFASHHVEYSYMATEKDNEASVKLFVDKLGYVKFRTPAILVNPVNNYRILQLPSSVEIKKLGVEEAEMLYRKFMRSAEFFPHDIDSILKNRLSLGTWVAYYRGETWDDIEDYPRDWAMLSVWNSGDVFKLRLGKAPLSCLIYTKSSKVMDRLFPCFRFPAIPDFFNPFGFYFMYGVHCEGKSSGKLVRTLCDFVLNMARKSRDCKVVVTEVGARDTVRLHIPHWKLLSCPEDLWCIKPLRKTTTTSSHHENQDRNINIHGHQLVQGFTRSPPMTNRALFVDPREV